MRKFLYITPYFPPQTRVGALRPLKFVRHLPALGWQPVVLADLCKSDGVDASLMSAVPPGVEVIRDYSRGARAAEERFVSGAVTGGAGRGAKRPAGPVGRAFASWASRLPTPSPEWIPLGEHSIDIPHALRAARRVLKAHPDIALIVVNADPWAALIVGQILAKETGLPLISDLRDPWSVCELRKPNRPLPQAKLVEHLERGVVEGSARFIVNTEAAARDYRAAYPDAPSGRFVVIRNHSDPELIEAGDWAPRDVFTALFFGNFRRHVEGDVVFGVLAELRRRGVGPDALRFMVTGAVPDASRAAALAAGVSDYIDEHAFVAYREAGSFLRSADLLVSLSNTSRQRIPAKMFDYLTAPRPIVSISDSAELGDMLRGVAGLTHHGLDDVTGIADAFQAALANGRQVTVERDTFAFSSVEAAERLVDVFESVCRSVGTGGTAGAR